MSRQHRCDSPAEVLIERRIRAPQRGHGMLFRALLRPQALTGNLNGQAPLRRQFG